MSKFDNFNKINKIETAFEHQANRSYSEESDSEDILAGIAEEFSIKNDIQIKKKPQPSKSKLPKPTLQKESQFQPFSYKNLKNNYLYKPKGSEDE